ncbi:hypothetical protein C1Y22_36555, partial [Pseudomonas sp. MPR-R2A5]
LSTVPLPAFTPSPPSVMSQTPPPPIVQNPMSQPPPSVALRPDASPSRRGGHLTRSRVYSFALDSHGQPVEIGSGRFAKAYLGEERW